MVTVRDKRSRVETLLFVFGDAELDSEDEFHERDGVV